MNNRKNINYNSLLPDYANCFVNNIKYNELKLISAYYRRKIEEISNNKTEYFNNVSRLMSGITLAHLTPEERKIVIADLVCSDEDIYNIMTDENNSDLFIALGHYFEVINSIKNNKISNKEERLGVCSSFTEHYNKSLALAFANYFKVSVGSINIEAIINKINCIYSYQYDLLYSRKADTLRERKQYINLIRQ